jgi:hypothetical protein
LVAAAAPAQTIPDLSGLDGETRQSLDLACIGAKLQGPVPYRRCLSEQLEALRGSPGIPDLYRFDYATRQSLALACNRAKSQGPAAYARCLHQQLDALRDAPRIPDLTGLDANSRHSLDLACISAKSQGPAVYGRCVQEQLDALRDAPTIPPLTAFDNATRQSLELACLTAKSSGLATYRRCLREQLDMLQASPAIPSLARLDEPTRQSIELACLGDKAHGPAAYGACVRAQLRTIGVEPDGATVQGARFAAPPTAPAKPPIVQTEPTGPQPESPGTIAAWSGLLKPAMPASVHAGGGSPDAVFSVVQRSVYVLLSGPSRDSFRTRVNVSQGSAVAISDRLALTNCHVLRGNHAHFLVRGKSVYEVEVAYGDILTDRCAVALRSGALMPVPGVRAFSSLVVGERVYTVGSPSGLENTLGEGIIAGLRRRGGVDLVQTSAPISPGSSGGGLFDSAGNLVGITAFLLRDNPTFNFAIAADAYWR